MTKFFGTARRSASRLVRAIACVTAFFAIGATGAMAQQSAYTPDKGRLDTSFGTVYQDYNSAWQGKTFGENARTVTIQEYLLSFSYGITDDLSLDASIGYGTLTGGLSKDPNRANPKGCWNQPANTLAARQCQDPIPQGSRDGLIDSTVGLRYRAVKEDSERWDSLPTIAVYGAAIIKGDYEPTPQALGNGANGFKTGIALGRYFKQIDFGINAGLEYQYLKGPKDVVPNNINGSVGVYKFIKSYFASASYQFQHSQSGWDTGEGPFPSNPDNLPANLVGPPDSRDYNRMLNAVGRKENWQSWQLGAGYVTDGGTVIYASYTDVFDGRNTADRSTWQLNLTVPTQLFHRE